jgi:hypothetical protein
MSGGNFSTDEEKATAATIATEAARLEDVARSAGGELAFLGFLLAQVVKEALAVASDGAVNKVVPFHRSKGTRTSDRAE